VRERPLLPAGVDVERAVAGANAEADAGTGTHPHASSGRDAEAGLRYRRRTVSGPDRVSVGSRRDADTPANEHHDYGARAAEPEREPSAASGDVSRNRERFSDGRDLRDRSASGSCRGGRRRPRHSPPAGSMSLE
jgi:hypothetical protein